MRPVFTGIVVIGSDDHFFEFRWVELSEVAECTRELPRQGGLLRL